jgi:hypothetical protein
MCCLADNFAQPFLGLGMTNKGVLIQLGAMSNKIEISASYRHPTIRNDVFSVLSFQIGRQISITRKDEDNYSFTPSIGYGYLRRQDFTEYNIIRLSEAPIENVKVFAPIYSLEFGKDAYLGRAFISASYCKELYFSIGIKMFTHR